MNGLTKSTKTYRCPWCKRPLYPSGIYPLRYRHCGRAWMVDTGGLVFDPIDLRRTRLNNPEHDSKVVNESEA